MRKRYLQASCLIYKEKRGPSRNITTTYSFHNTSQHQRPFDRIGNKNLIYTEDLVLHVLIQILPLLAVGLMETTNIRLIYHCKGCKAMLPYATGVSLEKVSLHPASKLLSCRMGLMQPNSQR